jgi:hypothetical protein
VKSFKVQGAYSIAASGTMQEKNTRQHIKVHATRLKDITNAKANAVLLEWQLATHQGSCNHTD